MFKNKLRALEHPTPENIDCSNRVHFANTVLWLEDQKIRLYKIDDRAPLRAIGTPDNWETKWEQSYTKYKYDVGMPTFSSPNEELSWLLIHAIRLEYSDNAETYKGFTAEQVNSLKKSAAAPKVASKNPFDKMNMSSADFENGVRNLGKKLNIGPCTKLQPTLEASSRLLNERFRSDAPALEQPIGKSYNVRGKDKCAFDDSDMDHAAKILRLLQIQSIRELQTSINETIVAVQEITADPKTDTKLGKVGY